jgi:hypothetical protein
VWFWRRVRCVASGSFFSVGFAYGGGGYGAACPTSPFVCLHSTRPTNCLQISGFRRLRLLRFAQRQRRQRRVNRGMVGVKRNQQRRRRTRYHCRSVRGPVMACGYDCPCTKAVGNYVCARRMIILPLSKAICTVCRASAANSVSSTDDQAFNSMICP